MPDDIRISEMTAAPDIDENTLVEVAAEDENSATGYSSYNKTFGAIFDKILRAVAFTSRLNTTNKTVFGAINELQAGGGGGASSLDDLTDVTITSPNPYQFLRRDLYGIWRNYTLNVSEVHEVIEDPYGQGDFVLDIDISYLLTRLQNPEKGNIYIKVLCPDGLNYDYYPYFGETISSGNHRIFFAAVQEVNGRPVLKLATGTEWGVSPDYTQIVWTTIPLEPLEVTGTLLAGNTSLTISNAAITTASTIQVFTDPPEIPRSAPMSVSTGSVTLTFEAQLSDVAVKLVIS